MRPPQQPGGTLQPAACVTVGPKRRKFPQRGPLGVELHGLCRSELTFSHCFMVSDFAPSDEIAIFLEICEFSVSIHFFIVFKNDPWIFEKNTFS